MKTNFKKPAISLITKKSKEARIISRSKRISKNLYNHYRANKMNQVWKSTGVAVTLLLSTSVYNLPANAQNQGGSYFKRGNEIVYICPQFKNFGEQLAALQKSANPNNPLCSQPSAIPPISSKPVKGQNPTTLISLGIANEFSSKLDSLEQQGNKQDNIYYCWRWSPTAGWLYGPFCRY